MTATRHDAVNIKFDGILGGQQFRVDDVDAAEAGIERGGLAGAGGSGDDENAVGPLDHLADEFMDVFRKTERLQLEIHLVINAVINALHLHLMINAVINALHLHLVINAVINALHLHLVRNDSTSIS